MRTGKEELGDVVECNVMGEKRDGVKRTATFDASSMKWDRSLWCQWMPLLRLTRSGNRTGNVTDAISV